MNSYLVIGSFHCLYIHCNSSVKAKKTFEHYYPGEPIISVHKSIKRTVI